MKARFRVRWLRANLGRTARDLGEPFDLITVLLVILLLLALGGLPTWPYRRQLGYYPSGGLGLLVVILLVLLLRGRI